LDAGSGRPADNVGISAPTLSVGGRNLEDAEQMLGVGIVNSFAGPRFRLPARQ
jgi:hypothetical protein